MFSEADKDRLLNVVYGGNIEAYNKAGEKGLYETMGWHEIEADSKVYPELDTSSDFLFRLLLGYLPPKHFTVRYNAFIKAAIRQYKDKIIDYDDFISEVCAFIRTIRNRELSWHKETYSEAEYASYNTYYIEQKDVALERIRKILGYTPELITSLHPQLMYRRIFATEPHRFINKVTSVDMQAATSIKYRECLLTYGLDEAKKMDFVAPSIIDRYNKGEIVF